jgi:hypothetical protein
MPSATSTSATSHTDVAPCAMSALVPALVSLCGEPGTASTVMPRFAASSTVIIEPPVARDSTTTSNSLAIASMRLRSGKRNASGAQPGGDSDTMTPRSATCCQSVACSRGYTTSRPEATTAIGAAIGAAMVAAIDDSMFGAMGPARCDLPFDATDDVASHASITPRCAAASMPRASPDTTDTPL